MTTIAQATSGQIEGDVLVALLSRGNRADTFGLQPRKTLAESLEEEYDVSENWVVVQLELNHYRKLRSRHGCIRCSNGAIDRANAASDVKEAAAEAGIDWRLLAALGLRGSGFKNIDEIGGGPHRGVFQVTPNKDISETEARDLATVANYAAKYLKRSMDYFSAVITEYSRNPWAVGARVFNTGIWNRYTLDKLISGDYISALDRGTAINNYVTSVLNLMDCFH